MKRLIWTPIHSIILFLIVSVSSVIAAELTFFTPDGAPIALRDEKRFPHAIISAVTFSASVDSMTVTLRTNSTEGRTAVSFTDNSSYIVICSKADSVIRLSGSAFRIWFPTALRGKSQQYIAVGN